MEKLDRLGWADGMVFSSYGVRIGVRVTRPDGVRDLLGHLPPGWKAASSPVVERLYSFVRGGPEARGNLRRFNLLYGNADRLARAVDLDPVLEAFESDLQLHIALGARRVVFVHAGVVGLNGRAIVFPGRSFSGKSTLVAELVRAGATYYSDEYAVLDTGGRVHPYPRPLSIRESGAGRPTKYPAEVLGGPAGVRPLPVGLVVVSEYRPGARWRPRRLSAGQGALALLAHTVSARRRPQRALAALRQVVAAAPVLKGARGEAKEVTGVILGGLAGTRGRA
jgi:hypothetical protein